MSSRGAEGFGSVTRTYNLQLQKDFSLNIHKGKAGKTKHLTPEI